MLEFRILGPLEVVRPEGPLELGGPKQRATLAILLLNANRVVSIDRLADQLYAGRAPVTAATQVHRQISELRKVLGEEARLETRAPGYMIHVGSEQLDVKRFELLTDEAGRALARGDAETSFDLQRDALALWRGPALADLDHEPFAQNAIGRLEELLLAALELRIDAELALGRHRELVGELDELAAQHPIHEPFVSRLMLSLYRSGRQADALEVYSRTRERLLDGFGIVPGRALRELERAILNQDAALNVSAIASQPVVLPEQIVLVLPSCDDQLDALLAVAEPLASLPGRSLLVARLLSDESLLAPTVDALGTRRASLGPEARTAAFTTVTPVDDAVRLAATYDVRLLLVDTAGLDDDAFPDSVTAMMERSPSDVGLLAGSAVDWGSGDGVSVPFAGGEHDWAALELAAWLASSRGVALRLLGARTVGGPPRRDASRLLADASMAVQRALGVEAVPQLVDPEPGALAEAVESAAIVVTGLPVSWRRGGLGVARRSLLRRRRPTLLVHCGPRPSGLAPPGSRTRFTWTIEPVPV
ncbi:MAG: AfsR/SARP family transcriptional regulator [Actinobacteria bacterium]|nr:AfsR/SARP family transcriptional regulator [Actinomycetota bacterium]